MPKSFYLAVWLVIGAISNQLTTLPSNKTHRKKHFLLFITHCGVEWAPPRFVRGGSGAQPPLTGVGGLVDAPLTTELHGPKR